MALVIWLGDRSQITLTDPTVSGVGKQCLDLMLALPSYASSTASSLILGNPPKIRIRLNGESTRLPMVT